LFAPVAGKGKVVVDPLRSHDLQTRHLKRVCGYPLHQEAKNIYGFAGYCLLKTVDDAFQMQYLR
jgi:hypothetical protein